VNRAEHSLWCRLVLTLFGVLWAACGTKPANAMGCHIEERPTLGLTQPWETTLPHQLTLTESQDSAPSYVPFPCSSDTPERSETKAAVGDLALNPTVAPKTVVEAHPHFWEPALAVGIRIPVRIDRPPRVGSRLG